LRVAAGGEARSILYFTLAGKMLNAPSRVLWAKQAQLLCRAWQGHRIFIGVFCQCNAILLTPPL
jgi:hypothetical protein